MQAFAIPQEVVAQAKMLNWLAGTLQAWSFLSSYGVPDEQIFVLLLNVAGPEQRGPVQFD
jgi:hypothetical protein